MIANTFTHNEKTIEIMHDEDPFSPRDYDNLGTILYNSTQYTLGDKRVEREEITEILKRKDVISLPVFAYIHSGITINTTGFSCPWDSGQCGIIYIEKKKIREEFGKKRISKELTAKVTESLRNEIKEYDQYLRGNVYGYIMKDATGKELDSCWGFYGLEYCEEEAKRVAEAA